MTPGTRRSLASPRPPVWFVAAVGVAVAIGYGLLGYVSRQTVLPEAGVSLIWLPAGFAVGLVARVRPILLAGVLPGIAVAVFVADLWVYDFGLVGTLLFVLANFVEQAGIGLVARKLHVTKLRSAVDLLAFAALTLVAVLLTAFLGAVAGHVTFGTQFGAAYLTWYFGAVTSILLVAPFVIVVGRPIALRQIRAVDVLLAVALVVVVAEILLNPSQAVVVSALMAALLIPLLTIIGVRTGIATVSALTPAVTYFIALGVANERFTIDDAVQGLPAVAALQSFVVLAAVTIYAAALIEQGRLVALAAELRAREDLEYQLRHDPLTGLRNRFGAREWLARRDLGDGAVALLVDLDEFKKLNDLLGVTAGDAVLIRLASRIAEHYPASTLIARYGPDEFLLVLPGSAGSTASAVREMQQNVLAPVALEHGEYPIDASIGVAVQPQGTVVSSDELLRRADLALNTARTAGGGRHEQYRDALDTRLRHEADIRAEVAEALENGSVQPWFQPVVRLDSHEPIGVEALARLTRADGSMLPPDTFIPVAEASGQILPLGGQILQLAVAEFRDRDLPPDFTIAVNVSERELRSDGYSERLLQTLREFTLPPQRLTLEVTEHVIIDDAGVIAGHLSDLRGAGVNVAIDDFGTGYSSLNAIRRLPANIVKIDRSFVAGIQESREDMAVVRAVLRVAEDLGKQVIAEGVETVATAQLLSDLGCRFAQGYLFGRPQPPAECAALPPRAREGATVDGQQRPSRPT